MSVAIEFRFSLGRYHATPWDRTANAGETEWPPSPWRILRALIATWHTRCPEIAANEVQSVVSGLAMQPPQFTLPRSTLNQTRHYLPQGDFRTDGGGKTVLTVDGQLAIKPEDALVAVWPDVVLSAHQNDVLRRLTSTLPYLGRAESACEALLLDNAPAISEGSYARPIDYSKVRDQGDEEELAVLVPEPNVTIEDLECTTDQMRKAGRAVPQGARWIPYVRRVDRAIPPVGADVSQERITMVRWAIIPPHPVRAEVGMLQTSALRARVQSTLKARGLLDKDEVALLRGHGLNANHQHQHAHWLFRPTEHLGRDVVSELILWVPGGVPVGQLDAVLSVGQLPRWPNAPKAYVPAGLELLSVTSDADSALVGPTRHWVSATPVTTRRHPKGQRARAEFWTRMIRRELELREVPGWDSVNVEVVSSTLEERALDAPHERSSLAENADRRRLQNPRAWRRYRWSERLNDARHAAHLNLTFSEAVPGPLVLGDLSHFGMGLFIPQPD